MTTEIPSWHRLIPNHEAVEPETQKALDSLKIRFGWTGGRSEVRAHFNEEEYLCQFTFVNGIPGLAVELPRRNPDILPPGGFSFSLVSPEANKHTPRFAFFPIPDMDPKWVTRGGHPDKAWSRQPKTRSYKK